MCADRKSSKARKTAPRSEIGEVLYYTGKFEFEEKDWKGNPAKVTKTGYRLWLRAVGPNGTYNYGESHPILGLVTEPTPAARVTLNEFLRDLWTGGWQPSSVGKSWYQFNYRRVVEEPSDTDSNEGEIADESISLKKAFRKIEKAYSEIRADLAAGRINPEQYRSQLENLRVQESSERWWKIDGQSGKWLMWDGKVWKPSEPPL